MRISIEQAAEQLKLGGVVAVPTETVYGLAASLYIPTAVAQIFSLKGRPADNPLIIHVSSCGEVEKLVDGLPKGFRGLAEAFWPGPMTLVLPIDPSVIPALPRANLLTAAFRVPNHPLTLELLRLTGPLVMPSANISGKPSATLPAHVETDFGSGFPLLDGGQCQHGLESTILTHLAGQWQIIRLGSLPPEAFQCVLGVKPTYWNKDEGERPLCPGQLYRHYAPRAKLTAATTWPEDFEGVILGFSDRKYPENATLVVLGSSDNPEEVAEGLYDVLRDLDKRNCEAALIDFQFPRYGLWHTIAERLTKAASG